MRSLVILAGGRGSRLGDLTRDIPKPMVDVHGKPFLYWLIQHYVNQGFDNITISTGYKSEVIENYLWPKEWQLQCLPDSRIEGHYLDFFESLDTWVVNGDTFIPDKIPRAYMSTILSWHGVDAGAQCYVGGKVHIHPVSQFFDIGTPFGLGHFRSYFKTHPIYLSYLKSLSFTTQL